MVKTIKIRTAADFKKAIGTLNEIERKLLFQIRESMREWGETKLEPDMKESAVRAGISSHTGELLDTGIDYRQGPKSDTGFLFIRDYGVKLDEMRPHYVSVTRRRTRFFSWAKQARKGHIRRKARLLEEGKIKSFGVFVKPHPFIEMGHEKARPKLNQILRRRTKIAVGGT